MSDLEDLEHELAGLCDDTTASAVLQSGLPLAMEIEAALNAEDPQEAPESEVPPVEKTVAEGQEKQGKTAKKRFAAPKLKEDKGSKVENTVSEAENEGQAKQGKAAKKKSHVATPKLKEDKQDVQVEKTVAEAENQGQENEGKAAKKKGRATIKPKDISNQVEAKKAVAEEGGAQEKQPAKKRGRAGSKVKDSSKVENTVAEEEEAKETGSNQGKAKRARKSSKGTGVCSPITPTVEKEEAKRDDNDDDDEEWGWDDRDAAEYILCRSMDGNFIVPALDKTLDSAGLVDGRAAKIQRTTGADPSCPVTLEMMDEYERWEKRFKMEFQDRLDRGRNLELENLAPGSALEMCCLLGKLQWENQLLSKGNTKVFGEKERMIRVPAITLSMVMQRIVDHERDKCAALVSKERDECNKMKQSLGKLPEKAKAMLRASGIIVDDT